MANFIRVTDAGVVTWIPWHNVKAIFRQGNGNYTVHPINPPAPARPALTLSAEDAELLEANWITDEEGR